MKAKGKRSVRRRYEGRNEEENEMFREIDEQSASSHLVR
jgi:hypothetical protein